MFPMHGGFMGRGPALCFDADVQAFLTATGIVDTNIESALCNFVTTLKADGNWSLFNAIYPLVGGTSDTHKYNLKDPQDTNAAFRLTYFGGITHDADGMQGNGANGYADTHIVTPDLANGQGGCCYSGTDLQATVCDWGSGFISGTFSSYYSFIRSASDQYLMRINNSQTPSVSNNNSTGFHLNSRVPNGQFRYLIRDGISTIALLGNSQLSSGLNITLMARNQGTQVNLFSSRQYRFFGFFPSDVFAVEQLEIRDAVNQLQIDLGRSI